MSHSHLLRGPLTVLVGTVLVVAAAFVGAPGAAAAGAADGDCVTSAPRHLEVRTIPSVEGFRFRLAGHVYTTGVRGRAALRSVLCADPEHALAPLTATLQAGDGRRASFDGWYFKDVLGRRGDGVVWASFKEQARVRLSLEDLRGDVVDRADVGAITLKGSTGAVESLPDGQTDMWLDAARVVRFSTGLVVKDILWSLQSVDIAGNNVVHRGALRFKPRKSPVVRARLLFFPLTLRVRDAVLGRPVGRTVTITSPDGRARTVRLDDRGRADVGLVGRGDYTLRAHGSNVVMGFDQPVAMSRPQDAELTVVSGWDVGLVGLVGLTVAAGLVAVGRRSRGRHRATVPAEPAPVPDPVGGGRLP